MPTRKTLFWLIAAGLLYIIALNVGSGWLYVVIALLAAFPAASLGLSYLNTRRLQVKQYTSERAVQGESLISTIKITNTTLLPRFLLRLESSHGGGSARVLLSFLGPKEERNVKICHNRVKRGVYTSSHVKISSSAPIGLAGSRCLVDAVNPLVVYPRWFRLAGDWDAGRKNSGYAAASTLPTRSTASDYLGVRDYRPEDSPRSIHWRTTARSGSLAVIEYARRATISPVFILDCFQDANIGDADESSFETAVTVAASLLQREALYNRRFAIGSTPEDAAGRGLSHEIEPAMLWLAQVEASAAQPLELSNTTLPWPGVTPVLILTSHAAYSCIDKSEFLGGFPQPVIIMLDGRGFASGRNPKGVLMDDAALERLTSKLEKAGCRFLLINSAAEVTQCLESL